MSKKEAIKLKTNWPKWHTDQDFVDQLKPYLAKYLKKCRWFGGKARTINQLHLLETIPFPAEDQCFFILLIKLIYSDGKVEVYQLPIGRETEKEMNGNAIATIIFKGKRQMITEAIYLDSFRNQIMLGIAEGETIHSNEYTLNFYHSSAFNTETEITGKSEILNADQSNTTLILEDYYFFKLYRKIDYEINPDLEISRFFTENTSFHHFPAFLGGLEFRKEKKPPIVLGMMVEKVENQGDSWKLMLKETDKIFQAMESKDILSKQAPDLSEAYNLSFSSLPEDLKTVISEPLAENIKLLGKRTAQMHKALASGTDTAFKPVPFNDEDYQINFFDQLEQLTAKRISLANTNRNRLPAKVRTEVAYFEQHRETILNFFRDFKSIKTDGQRIRIHGDYHLGQVLFTGDDFVILDFEGEPESTISARKIKHTPMKDLAGMIRSYHYALYSTILFNDHFEDLEIPEEWTEALYLAVKGLYLNGYLEEMEDHEILPGNKEDFIKLLDIHTLEKAIYELGYELNGRPDWAMIPLKGINYLINKQVSQT